MALMNLLTAGRSLSEARERPHRYKVRKGALPKFGNVGAQAGVRKSPASVETSERTENAVELQPMNSNTVAETMRGLPVLGEWTRKISLFKPARPIAAERPAVQGELSLDRVKPVRNDLSDSDLELVAVTRQPEATPGVVKIESVEVPVVQAVPLLARVRGLFRRAT
jgi:hypothetical protein